MTYKLTNQNVKEVNRRQIYKYIYSLKGEKANKQQIAKSLGLSQPTVATCLDELLEKNLLSDSGYFVSTGGRRSQAISVNKEAFYSVGLNLTQSYTEMVVLNAMGELLQGERIPVIFSDDEEYYAVIRSHLEQQFTFCGIDESQVLGIGISAPALVDAGNTHSPYLAIIGREDWNIDLFQQYMPLKCQLYNDSNSGCFTEIWDKLMFNKIDADVTLAYLSIDETVGGAFFHQNDIYMGDHHFAGEFGHMTLVANGKSCYCGQKGCVNAYLSTRTLTGTGNSALSDFFNALQQQVPSVVEAWNNYVVHLINTIHNLRMVFDCNVMIGGALAHYLTPYKDFLSSQLANKNIVDHTCKYLKISTHAEYANAVGAALNLTHNFISAI